MAAAKSHRDRLDAEINVFKDIDIHNLPDIFHYWSNTHLGPYVAQAFGVANNIEIFATEIAASIAATGNSDIVSIGAGDGEIEQHIALALQRRGVADFTFHCLELSPHMIARGSVRIAAAGLQDHIRFEQVDLGAWAPQRTYGAAFAHHSLHHIIALEHVFDMVHAHLAETGAFVCADVIGRNGHMRWPETLAIIDRIWERTPVEVKYNHLLKCVAEPFWNWDCSKEGFEGVRAQDILPLLLERFHFEKFAAWGGLTDMFIDRAYGFNLDADDPATRRFIDDLWAADRALIRLGATTPTQLIAVMKKTPRLLHSSDELIPRDCVRPPAAAMTRRARERLLRRAWRAHGHRLQSPIWGGVIGLARRVIAKAQRVLGLRKLNQG